MNVLGALEHARRCCGRCAPTAGESGRTQPGPRHSGDERLESGRRPAHRCSCSRTPAEPPRPLAGASRRFPALPNAPGGGAPRLRSVPLSCRQDTVRQAKTTRIAEDSNMTVAQADTTFPQVNGPTPSGCDGMSLRGWRASGSATWPSRGVPEDALHVRNCDRLEPASPMQARRWPSAAPQGGMSWRVLLPTERPGGDGTRSTSRTHTSDVAAHRPLPAGRALRQPGTSVPLRRALRRRGPPAAP